MSEIIKVKRTPVIFEDNKQREAARKLGFRKVPMVMPPNLDSFDTGVNGTHGVNTSRLTKDQLNALSQESLATWCCTVRPTVDGKRFDFDEHRYLIPLYSDDSKEIVVKKAAQMGASTFMFLDVIHALNRRPIKAGLFLPTEGLISTMAKDRLDPILEENPEFAKSGVNVSQSVKLKHIGKGSLYMLYMGGRDSKDSVPLDKITFDEVRLMDPKDVDQAKQRVAASKHKIIRWLSTPGYPDRDISRMFSLSTQAHWHSKCGCPDGINLALEFPNCIMEYRGDVFYYCPKCKMKITDPQNGWFVEYNPGHFRKGYAFSQLISKAKEPIDILREYNETTNVQDFYNSVLGREYVDESNKPINESQLYACVNTDLQWNQRLRKVYMGVDVMDQLSVVVILGLDKDNRMQIIHLEWVDTRSKKYKVSDTETPSPFDRLYKLMDIYNVDVCCVDKLPHTNEALQFAQAFPGRVYLSLFREGMGEMVTWTDKEKAGHKKAARETTYKYQLLLNQYEAFEFMFGCWKRRRLVMPPPRAIVQDVRNSKGEFEPTFMGELLFKHMLVMIKEKYNVNEDTGSFKMRWIYVGGEDPHFCQALCLAIFAASRKQSNKFLGW